jgi:hypothetical protein
LQARATVDTSLSRLPPLAQAARALQREADRAAEAAFLAEAQAAAQALQPPAGADDADGGSHDALAVMGRTVDDALHADDLRKVSRLLGLNRSLLSGALTRLLLGIWVFFPVLSGVFA